MSYLVCRMEKRKKDDIHGMRRHNQREFKNYSNKDIDTNKSHLNYDLVNKENIDFLKSTMNVIEEKRESKKSIRKDAVLLNEFIVTSGQEFFKDMNDKEIKKFFETSKEFFQKRYGEENVISANVHMDELTPHMHLTVCPLRGGRLQSKNIFNRKELRYLQDELPKILNKNGFDIERGVEGATKEHTKTRVFKAYEEKRLKELEEKNKELESKIASRKEKLEEVKDLDFKIESKKTVLNNLNQGNDCLDEDIKYKLDGFDVKMDYIEFRKFQTQIASIKKVKKENEDLKNENTMVHSKCTGIMESQNDFTDTFTNWINRVHDHLPIQMREQFKRRSSEALVDCETGNYDKDNTLDNAVMNSKAFNEDVYIKCTNDKQNSLKEPTMGYNKFEMDWE